MELYESNGKWDQPLLVRVVIFCGFLIAFASSFMLTRLVVNGPPKWYFVELHYGKIIADGEVTLDSLHRNICSQCFGILVGR